MRPDGAQRLIASTVCKIAVMSLVGLTTVPSLAFAYDDPAVAVCEYAWAHARNIPANSYTRDEAEILGSSVKLTFSYFPLNIRPRQITIECRFQRDWDDTLTLERAEPEEVATCRKRTEDAHIKLEQVNRVSAEGEKAQADIDACKFTLRAADVDKDRWQSAVISPLTDLGIYPIKINETELKVE